MLHHLITFENLQTICRFIKKILIWGGKVAQGFFEARNILKIEDTPDEPVHLL